MRAAYKKNKWKIEISRNTKKERKNDLNIKQSQILKLVVVNQDSSLDLQQTSNKQFVIRQREKI